MAACNLAKVDERVRFSYTGRLKGVKLDTPEEFAARAYAFVLVCKEKGWIVLPDADKIVDELLSQAPIETFYSGWAHIAQAIKEVRS